MQEAATKSNPFALFLSYGTPHAPWDKWNVPDEYRDLFVDTHFALPPNYQPVDDPYVDSYGRLSEQQRATLLAGMRGYYAMNSNLDWNVGRLLAALKPLGLHEDTIVVFTSDHDEMLGVHSRRGKNIFYEEAVGVPFFDPLSWQITCGIRQ